MSYGPKGGKGSRRTFLYVEALRKFQDEAKMMDLKDSYKKALPTYSGRLEHIHNIHIKNSDNKILTNYSDRLEHTFVILKDTDAEAQGLMTGSNNVPIGNKRQAEDESESSPKRPK